MLLKMLSSLNLQLLFSADRPREDDLLRTSFSSRSRPLGPNCVFITAVGGNLGSLNR